MSSPLSIAVAGPTRRCARAANIRIYRGSSFDGLRTPADFSPHRRHSMNIRPFRPDEEPVVVALWQECGLTRSWNDPHKDIARKLAVQPELFLVGVTDGAVMASVMA